MICKIHADFINPLFNKTHGATTHSALDKNRYSWQHRIRSKHTLYDIYLFSQNHVKTLKIFFHRREFPAKNRYIIATVFLSEID